MSIRERQWQSEDGKVLTAWSIDVKMRVPGKGVVRVRQVSPINTKRGAQQFEHRVRQSVLDGSYTKQKEEEEKPAETFASFLPRYLTYSENNNKASTLASKRMLVQLHLLPFFGSIRLDAIGSASVEAFKAAMLKKTTASRVPQPHASKGAIAKRYGRGPRPLSKKTINNALTVLKNCLSFAVEQGELQHAPRVRLFKMERPEFDFLSFGEADAVTAAFDEVMRPAAIVAMRAGLRIGELRSLQWSDFDAVRSRITVRRSFWNSIIGVPKSGRSRIVDVPPSVVAALGRHPRHVKAPWVFSDAEGEPLSVKQFDMALDAAVERAGVRREEGRIGWHDLRHTYGSHMAMRGVSMPVLRELMGHASIETTMRYAHLSPEVKQEAVKLLDAPPPAAFGAQAGHMKSSGQ
jgi:integrase